MIRKFAEIQGSWYKQKKKKKERLTSLKHAVTTLNFLFCRLISSCIINDFERHSVSFARRTT